jgi:hypothetical protein
MVKVTEELLEKQPQQIKKKKLMTGLTPQAGKYDNTDVSYWMRQGTRLPISSSKHPNLSEIEGEPSDDESPENSS